MQQVEFGHRQSRPDASGETPALHLDGGAVGGPDRPVHIEKQLGVPLAALLVPFAIVVALQLVPLVLSGLPLKDVLLHIGQMSNTLTN